MLTLHEGWKSIDQITKNDLVATLLNGNTLQYAHPLQTFVYDHDGDVMDIDSQRVKHTVTMDHINYVMLENNKYKTNRVFKYDGVSSRQLLETKTPRVYFKKTFDEYEKPEQEYFTLPETTLLFNGVPKLYVQQIFPMNEWLKFFGLFITEGYVDQSNMIRISAHKQRVKIMLDDISPKLGFNPMIYAGEPNYYYYSNRSLADYLSKSGTSINKFLPQWALELNMTQSRILLIALITGDGTFEKNGDPDEFYTGSEDLCKDVEQLIFHCGWTYGGDIKRKKGEKLQIKGVDTVRNSNQYRLRITKGKIAINPLVYKENITVKKYTGKVYCIEIPSHVFLVRQKGDRFINSGVWSRNSGQKGVCGLNLRASDMMFTESGMGIDMIKNPHSFPKRMTIGQVIEGGLSKVCVRKGCMTDATVFRKIEMDDIVDELRAMGADYFGRERVYCGMSGYWMDALIFLCPIYYQRLQKFVAKSVYSIDIGPTDIITRQPLDGKANQGGLRISELQRDVLLAHGCARFFSEKFFTDSDDFEVYICQCGTRAIVNTQIGIYECSECGDDADIYAIYSSWSSKQFLMELNAMHIGTQFKLEPFVLYDGI